MLFKARRSRCIEFLVVVVNDLVCMAGRQFRACVISTVLTKDGFRERGTSDDTDFLSNRKLLNTVITRAQSLVLVVGDPLCLCTCGKLDQLWLQYIAYCHDNRGCFGTMSFEELQIALGILHTKLNPESQEFVPTSDSAAHFSRRVDNTIKTCTDKTSERGSEQHCSVAYNGELEHDMVEEYRHQVAQSKIEHERLQTSSKAIIQPVEKGSGYEWQIVDDSTVDDRVKYESSVLYEEHLRGNARFEAIKREPNKYFRCRLHVTNGDDAVAIAYKIPNMEISIRGWKRRNRSFDGEEVLVRLDDTSRGRKEITSRNGTVVGIFQEERPSEWVCVLSKRGKNILLPLDKSFPCIINLPRNVQENGIAIFKKGVRRHRPTSIEPINFIPVREASCKLFIVQFLKWRIDCMHPLGIVVEVLPFAVTLESGIDILSRQYFSSRIDDALSQDAENDVTKFSRSISPKEYFARGMPLTNAFTIDSANSTDLDDALSFEQDAETGSCRVSVYISDVSYFCRFGSSLDYYAFTMGTTYYDQEGRRKLDMFPKRLSPDLFSLLPGVDRLAIRVGFEFDRNAKLVRLDYSRCIVRSKRKLSYETVEKIISGSLTAAIDEELTDEIRRLYDLSVCLRRQRLGGTRYHLQDRETAGCQRAHAMVEEFMLLTNKTVAESLIKKCRAITPLIAQGSPDSAKVEEWIKLFGGYFDSSCALSEIANKLTIGSQLTTIDEGSCGPITISRRQWRDIQLATEIEDDSRRRHQLRLFLCTESLYPQLAIAHTGYHRCLKRSLLVCADHNDEAVIRHNHLGYQYYTHFTSPIRRYIDIVAHRLLIAYDFGLEDNDGNLYTEEKINKICCHCSRTRVLAQRYQREMDLFGFSCSVFNSPVLTTAVVRSVSAGSMELYFPDYPNLTGKATEIRFSSLNPKHISTYENGSVTVTWSIKVVQHPLLTEKKQYRNKLPHDDYYSIPICEWKQLLLLSLSESSKPDDLIRRIRHIENSVHTSSSCFDAQGDLYSATGTGKEDIVDSNHKGYDEVSDSSDLDEYFTCDDSSDLDEYFTCDEYMTMSDESADKGKLQSFQLPKIQLAHSTVPVRPMARLRKKSKQSYRKVFCSISQKYMTGSLFSLQLSARVGRGMLTPVIQLFPLPGSVPAAVCVEHYSKPADCFVESLPHGHNSSRDRYHDIIDYANSWLPVVDHESATSCVKDSSDYVLVSGTSVRWTRTVEKVSSSGEITLTSSFSRQYSLGCREGDFLCLSYSNLVAQKARFCIDGDKVDSLLKGSSSKEVVHTDTDQCVVHCRVVDSKVEDKPDIEGAPCRQFLKVKTSGERQALPEMLFNSKVPVLCTAQFISQCLPFMRMRQALQVICSEDYSNDVVKSLCSGDFSRVTFDCRYSGNTSGCE